MGSRRRPLTIRYGDTSTRRDCEAINKVKRKGLSGSHRCLQVEWRLKLPFPSPSPMQKVPISASYSLQSQPPIHAPDPRTQPPRTLCNAQDLALGSVKRRGSLSHEAEESRRSRPQMQACEESVASGGFPTFRGVAPTVPKSHD